MTSTENSTRPADQHDVEDGPTDREATDPGPTDQPAGRPGPAPLMRSRRDRYVAGVCGGLAEHLGMDVTLLRVLMVVLAIVGNLITVAVYLACWVVMPDEEVATSTPASTPPASTR